MHISDIVVHLTDRKVISSSNWNCKTLTGGTSSQIYLLSRGTGTDFIVKLNEAKVIYAEAEFLAAYQQLVLLPQLVFVDPSNKFMVYTYLPGSAGDSDGSKKEILCTLAAELLNQYQPSFSEGWGRQDALVDSWEKFLSEEVQEATQILAPFLKKQNFSIPAPLPLHRDRNKVARKPYLVHGDCGVHNFIFKEGRLVGVIDPTPVFGFPHYDLIYAFFSTPAELTKEVLDSAITVLSTDVPARKQLYEEVLIVLYQRLGICVKHHPVDFPAYLEAWNYWREIVDCQ